MSKIDEVRADMVKAMKAKGQRHKGNFIHAACSS